MSHPYEQLLTAYLDCIHSFLARKILHKNSRPEPRTVQGRVLEEVVWEAFLRPAHLRESHAFRERERDGNRENDGERKRESERERGRKEEREGERGGEREGERETREGGRSESSGRHCS